MMRRRCCEDKVQCIMKRLRGYMFAGTDSSLIFGPRRLHGCRALQTLFTGYCNSAPIACFRDLTVERSLRISSRLFIKFIFVSVTIRIFLVLLTGNSLTAISDSNGWDHLAQGFRERIQKLAPVPPHHLSACHFQERQALL